jgi:hypothetical protein
LKARALIFQGDRALANPAVTPSAAPCRKVARWRVIAACVVVLAAVVGGISAMSGDARTGLLIGLGPLLLAGLVCFCSPCSRESDTHRR